MHGRSGSGRGVGVHGRDVSAWEGCEWEGCVGGRVSVEECPCDGD